MQRSIVDLPEPDGPAMTTALAVLDAQIDLVEHPVVAEALGDPLEDDHRLRRALPEAASALLAVSSDTLATI